MNLNTRTGSWSGTPKGNEWAAHLHGAYNIPLDHWSLGLKLVPEAYIAYREGNIKAHEMTNGDNTFHLLSSRQKSWTTRIGTGLNYTLPDLSAPSEVSIKLGLEKSFMEQPDNQTSNAYWAKTPTPEAKETAIYYGLGFNRQFGSNLDKLIGLEYMGSHGDKSGSDALTLTYRQRF